MAAERIFKWTIEVQYRTDRRRRNGNREWIYTTAVYKAVRFNKRTNHGTLFWQRARRLKQHQTTGCEITDAMIARAKEWAERNGAKYVNNTEVRQGDRCK